MSIHARLAADALRCARMAEDHLVAGRHGPADLWQRQAEVYGRLTNLPAAILSDVERDEREAAEAQRMRPNGHPVPVAPGYPPVVDLDATIVQPALTVVRPSDVPQHRM